MKSRHEYKCAINDTLETIATSEGTGRRSDTERQAADDL